MPHVQPNIQEKPKCRYCGCHEAISQRDFTGGMLVGSTIITILAWWLLT